MPMIIDAFEFARHAEEAAGSIPISKLVRIDVIDRSGELDWRAAGNMNRDGKLFLSLEVRGQVVLACQRCLGAMQHVVNVQSRFLLVGDEAEAEAVPVEEDDYDALVGSGEFDLVALIEDEVILSLPIVPKHESCPVAPKLATAGDEAESNTESGKPSPFAALAALRSRPKS